MAETNKAPRIKSIAAPTGTFPVEITVRSLQGEEGTITFNCIARTQTAWARERGQLFEQARVRQKAHADKLADADAAAAPAAPAPTEPARAAPPAAEGEAVAAAEAPLPADVEVEVEVVESGKPFDPERLLGIVSAGIKNDAEMVPSIAKGWDLDDEFSIATLSNMEDTYPGATTALVTAYSQKIHGARLGN